MILALSQPRCQVSAQPALPVRLSTNAPPAWRCCAQRRADLHRVQRGSVASGVSPTMIEHMFDGRKGLQTCV